MNTSDSVWEFLGRMDAERAGREMFQLAQVLFPVCRSITGHGVRETLRSIDSVVPLKQHEVPTGTAFFDWTIPKEWNIRDAYIADVRGRKLVEFKHSNLHVMGYSTPIQQRVTREELLRHVYTDPKHPRWIPYRNSYYKENWGFCVAHEQLALFTDDEYDVRIDATLADGHLTYGEMVLPGETSREVLISTHVCHPALANDNVSGMVVATKLAEYLRNLRTRYTYRFLFVPCTIGPIAWLGRNPTVVPRIDHGLVLACVGDGGKFTYVRSRRDNAEIDRALQYVMQSTGTPHELRAFAPYGYDQRQYCSPGFNLPMGCLMRTPNGEYPEYHTSGDNLEVLQPRALAESVRAILEVVGVLEDNRTYVAAVQHGEPQLGRRGLYDKAQEFGLFWLLNFSDGAHSVLDIAEKSKVPFHKLAAGVRMLEAVDLLRPHS